MSKKRVRMARRRPRERRARWIKGSTCEEMACSTVDLKRREEEEEEMEEEGDIRLK